MPHRGRKEQGKDRMTVKQRSWAIPVILLAMGMVMAPGRVSLAQDALGRRSDAGRVLTG